MSYEQLLALGERLGKVKRGASETAITALPSSKFKKKERKSDKKDGSGGQQDKGPGEKCCICLSEFEDGDTVRRLPCLHIFHEDEIDKWLRENNTCPICKTPIDAGGAGGLPS
mmetsp:Transcript_25216/g.47064  ORF Transcript_25216/g.47064 Transcript_25216/m.47064 type:complete len:113 (-) Transcript_25216:283-621(-)|eukprot:CAMPEP_0170182836 /NCGR_PEP_ID=MMETSP0040_2-20121228/28933_1 /TAXON_ID=641309 /ORGANISM="Lotharella oceanica, Strain CCMP622" /LENGTH=112 /DNA_ID=CAMNT_0010428391 /DNA_START=20 /DNA_END=358 /DNA_ORIENTATION=+